MGKSIYLYEYNASLIPPEEYNNIAVDTEQDKQENNSSNPDDQVDVAQISLKSLINKVDWKNILEIWCVTYITHNPNSTPHFVIILLDQGCKIAQVATEKKRFDVLDVLNNILEELYDTDEGADELNSNRILNPHMVRSKGRSRNKRFKSSVELCKSSNKSVQDSNGQESSNFNTGQGKSLKTCSNCNASNHNIRRCTAPCKLCGKESHTYIYKV
ncbi:hypothetical protein C1645_738050 [Glomus cerebriforme]|uniref:Uncharacterized protein n=1 Tax=Glomus cerebriforme TaxID=658196 RepID=A0A397SWY3_9GLOM|nr:hypothetical protein C1645_738050 [Glomus cerebriforme]